MSSVMEKGALEFQQVHFCRFCKKPLRHVFVDLGMSPLCESYRSAQQLSEMEPFYPLRVYVCSKCYLVQLPEYVRADAIFSEYAYFSSYSDSWLAHAERYVEMVIERFGLSGRSQVVEVASNDGYLLQYFIKKNIPVLGIEPAANIAAIAREKGIPTYVKFFGVKTAEELAGIGLRPDLLLGNNVLAHVPDINDLSPGSKSSFPTPAWLRWSSLTWYSSWKGTSSTRFIMSISVIFRFPR